MTGKNNRNTHSKQVPHYGLRKLSVGVASVLLSTTIYLGASAGVAHASTLQDDQSTTMPDQNKQVEPGYSSASNSLNDSAVPQAKHSLNDQVGDQADQIKIVSSTVTETPGDASNGTPGTTILNMRFNIPAKMLPNLQEGDYIDIRLGLPYQTNDGKQHVMSYGAIPNENKPYSIQYTAGVIAGYIVPNGDIDHYAQTTGNNGSLVVDSNDNSSQSSLGTSNGTYRLIFTNEIKNYLASKVGTSSDFEFPVELKWYNATQDQKKKAQTPASFTLYTDGEPGTYQPVDDLQVGDKKLASGLTFNVQKVDHNIDDQMVSNETVASDHTGSIPAHIWFVRSGQSYLSTSPYKGTHGPEQSVGLSLSTKDQHNHDLGNHFTITVTKPSDKDGVVSFNTVDAKTVQEQLQKLIIGADSKSELADPVGTSGNYYLSNPGLYSQPKVTVHETTQGNTTTFDVSIDGGYKGFKKTYSYYDNNYEKLDSIITLINWHTADPTALLPPKDGKNNQPINSFKSDGDSATYAGGGSRIYGFPIKGTDVIDYMKNQPWHVSVKSDQGFNYDTDYGFWIDASNDNPPENSGYVNNTFYGWVDQVIHYVDENGNQMVNAKGDLIPDENRSVEFTSQQPTNDFDGQQKTLENIEVPKIDGYQAYAGLKDKNGKLKIVDGKAIIDNESITKYGAEPAFGFPHEKFVEYVVYKKDEPSQPEQKTNHVTIHYIDVDSVVKKHPNQESFKPTDGPELENKKQQLTDQTVGSEYENTLWNYKGAGYVLATPSVDPRTEKGTIPEIDAPNDFYVYLKHGSTALPDQQKLSVDFIDDITKETLKTVTKVGPSKSDANYQTKKDIQEFEQQGYTLVSDETDGQELYFDNDDNVDQHYIVHLTHGSDIQPETKVVNETIHYIYQNGPHAGEPAASDYTDQRILMRTKTVDQVNGSVTYGPWNTVEPFVEVKSPMIKDYTADLLAIPEIAVTENSGDIIKNVYYTMKPNPVTPNTPVTPDSPHDEPGTNTPKDNPGNDNPQPGTGVDHGHPESGNHHELPQMSKGQAKLPQTGNTTAGLASLGLVAMMSALGLGLKRRKNN